jgi:Mrp family chromosome partitioning ATPase
MRVRIHEPAYQQVQLAILAEEPNIASLEAKVAKLESQLKTARRDLAVFNQNALRIVQLERELELLESAYRETAEGLKQARIDRALASEKISSISVVQSPTLPSGPISPRPVLNLVLALFLGAVGGVGLAVVSEYTDSSLKRPEDIERSLSIPTLASIPRLAAGRRVAKGRKQRADAPCVDGHGAIVAPRPSVPDDQQVAGYFETLRDRLVPSSNGARAPRVLAVVSYYEGEGVTTIASNLTASFEERSTRPPLLVPLAAIHESLANGGPHYEVIALDDRGETVGSYEANDLAQLFEELGKHYSYVILDMPALRGSAMALRVARLADAVILVVEAERIRSPAAARAKALLTDAQARVVGAVLNKRRFHIPNFVYRRL